MSRLGIFPKHESTHVDGGTDEIDSALDVRALTNVFQMSYGVSWDESQATGGYTRTGILAGYPVSCSPPAPLIPIQAAMRRCILNDAGEVQYYLDPTDSTLKSDGVTASDLTGGDGQVMVQIRKFYHRYSYAGTTHTHDISLYPLDGFTVHNMFIKNGVEVDYRYMSAYEGVLYDVSESIYANGIYQTAVSCVFANADKSFTIATRSHWASKLAVGDKIVVSGTTNNNGTFTVATLESDTKITVDEAVTDETAASTVIQTEKDWTATTGDKLCSVSGKAPINYGTRANFRAAAKNRGTGWRQQDFDLASGIQLLYLVEYADWNSQSMIGNGLTDWASAWSAWNDSNPINFTGLTNALGNATGNLSNGDGVVGSYMSYRGIENFFGHLWKWVDGININANVPYVSNTDTEFADDTTTNYTALGVTLHNGNGYVVTLEQIARGFLCASVAGGSGSTYVTDYYYQSTVWRVAKLGGAADLALAAGVAAWYLTHAASALHQDRSGRLAF